MHWPVLLLQLLENGIAFMCSVFGTCIFILSPTPLICLAVHCRVPALCCPVNAPLFIEPPIHPQIPYVINRYAFFFSGFRRTIPTPVWKFYGAHFAPADSCETPSVPQDVCEWGDITDQANLQTAINQTLHPENSAPHQTWHHFRIGASFPGILYRWDARKSSIRNSCCP